MALVQGRARVGIGVAIAALALIAPSAAFGAHDLRIYKMEKQVVLDSDEDTDVNLACLGTDRVLDGMWRIDHADLDEDEDAKQTLAEAVDVREAWSDTASRYHFSFVKNAIYRVQLKVFVTCLGEETEGGGANPHKHQMTYSPASGAPNTSAAIPAGSVGLQTATASCPSSPKQILVAPGFKLTPDADVDVDPDDLTNPPVGLGRLFHSNLTNTTPTSPANAWTWKFALGTSSPANGGAAVEVSWRCLMIRVDKLPGGASAPDRHKLVKKVRSGTPTVGASGFTSTDRTCGDHYKAVIGGFAIDPADVSGGLAFGSWKVWYLGMDPRPKLRHYRFLNTGTADTVTTSVVCLNYRTT